MWQVLSASRVSALDAYEDLKTNVVAEHQIHMEFVIFMFKNVSGLKKDERFKKNKNNKNYI